jgi:predicted amidohydrolase
MNTAGAPIMNVPGGGSSAIFAPDGRRLTAKLPSSEQGILYAMLDPEEILKARAFVDVCGHYSRPDLLWLGVETDIKVHVREDTKKTVS